MVSTYEIVMADIKALARYNWKYIVVDEGHRLKNFNCKLIRDLKTLPADNKLLLTGVCVRLSVLQEGQEGHRMTPPAPARSIFIVNSLQDADSGMGAEATRCEQLVFVTPACKLIMPLSSSSKPLPPFWCTCHTHAGTPLQNNLSELWSLLNFLMPDIFANQGDFQGWFDFSGVGSGANEAADQNIVAAEQKNQVREADCMAWSLSSCADGQGSPLKRLLACVTCQGMWQTCRCVLAHVLGPHV